MRKREWVPVQLFSTFYMEKKKVLILASLTFLHLSFHSIPNILQLLYLCLVVYNNQYLMVVVDLPIRIVFLRKLLKESKRKKIGFTLKIWWFWFWGCEIILKVEELHKEVKKEKELKSMYKIRLERTQDYLKYCLQVAQDNGFLNHIINKKDNPQESSPTSSSAIVQASTNPQTPPNVQQNTNLLALIEQAKLNGWYIDPHEVHTSTPNLCKKT